jgi:hypothetical protein
MASSNQVVLQQWFGELPDGTKIEKPSFQIFIEGPEVTERRGTGIVRELIGFVGKNPGEPVNFLPVIDAFRDLLTQIRIQIAQGLIQWREAELEKAKQLLAQAEAMSGSGDAITEQYADQALQAASEAVAKATENHAVEQTFARSSDAPDPEAIKQFVESITKPASEAETGESADDQNL